MQVSSWQIRLLPFLVIIITILATGFISFYFIHMNQVEKALTNPPQFQSSAPAADNNSLSRWNDLKDLEQFTIANRHYNARLIIRSRLLMISLSFLTGMVLCFVGSIFILGKFSEDATILEGGEQKMKFKLASSSPGIVLSFLGIVIICASIFSKIELNVSESPLFMPVTSAFIYDNLPDTSQYNIDTTKVKKMDDIINKYRPK